MRVGAKNSIIPGVTYPRRQTYSAAAFSFLEGFLEGVLLTSSALGLNLPLTFTVVSFLNTLKNFVVSWLHTSCVSLTLSLWWK